ncbi:hypothetical protein [Streptomyces sp. NPDC087297]|uniref:hypothetical protein n=1 Tax=Streptomyces sp. NPDC087297 TaxID=3365778 RepID=UPI003807147B
MYGQFRKAVDDPQVVSGDGVGVGGHAYGAQFDAGELVAQAVVGPCPQPRCRAASARWTSKRSGSVNRALSRLAAGADDGDLTNALLKAASDLLEGGAILLLTP